MPQFSKAELIQLQTLIYGNDAENYLLLGRFQDNWARKLVKKLADLRAEPEPEPQKIEKTKIYCILVKDNNCADNPDDCDIFFSCTEGNMINENTYAGKLEEAKTQVGCGILQQVREVVFEVSSMQVAQLFGPVTLSATPIEDK